MSDVLLCLVLGQLILLPLARKWELDIRTVSASGLAIGLVAGCALVVTLRHYDLALWARGLAGGVLITALAAGALLARFYRDPERMSPAGDDIIVSPADGIIKYIKPLAPGELPVSVKRGKQMAVSEPLREIVGDQGGYLIGIAMTFLDVHVIRAAIKGTLTHFEHIDGCFLSLKRADAMYRNERVLEVIENDRYAVGLVQIASRLVRRIVGYVREGEQLELGQRIGMIKLGSQVDVILPRADGLRLLIETGDRVYAGVSILAGIGQTLKMECSVPSALSLATIGQPSMA
ncbi:MAG: phosphatidylserine decarboxylase [Planctomycetota bacterium]|jgi:phosphatidylserine decarboxylase